MISPQSRYQEAERLFALAHTYDEAGAVEVDENGVQILASRDTTYMLATLPLPDPPDADHVLKVTDTFDTLATDTLGGADRWWLIADANPQIRYPLDWTPGQVINMPS